MLAFTEILVFNPRIPLSNENHLANLLTSRRRLCYEKFNLGMNKKRNTSNFEDETTNRDFRFLGLTYANYAWRLVVY